MTARRTACIAAFLAAGCAACATLPPGPATAERLPGDYLKIATCAYQRANAIDQTGLRFTELRAAGAAMINRDIVAYTTTPLWEAKFTSAGPNATLIEVRAFPTIWGADFHAVEVIEYARACAR